MPRIDGRSNDQLRVVRFELDYMPYAEGSVLVAMGDTRLACAVSIEDSVPPFLRNSGRGWITAEYSMLPRATLTRSARESRTGRPSGRTQEISRLIGRALRAAVDMTAVGERTLTIDCDVIQADGGTRTAAITGSYVALALAMRKLTARGAWTHEPKHSPVAAVSVGIVEGLPMLDLCYSEDSAADADVNVVMTAAGQLIEVQGTAERKPFSRNLMNDMLDLADAGIKQLVRAQQDAIASGGGKP